MKDNVIDLEKERQRRWETIEVVSVPVYIPIYDLVDAPFVNLMADNDAE